MADKCGVESREPSPEFKDVSGRASPAGQARRMAAEFWFYNHPSETLTQDKVARFAADSLDLVRHAGAEFGEKTFKALERIHPAAYKAFCEATIEERADGKYIHFAPFENQE